MTPEDALKAVEALCQTVSEVCIRIGAVDIESKALRLMEGCRMLRKGHRGAPEAQEIVTRPLEGGAGEEA